MYDRSEKIKMKDIAFYLAVLMTLIYVGLKDPRMLHNLGEVFYVFIGFSVAIIAYNTHKLHRKPNYLNHAFLLLGTAYASVSSFQILHVFTHDTTVYSTNLSYQFAIIAYYLESIAIVFAFKNKGKKMNVSMVYKVYFIGSFLLLISVVKLNIFPNGYIEGSGKTQFMLVSRYIIIVMLGLSAFILSKNRTNFNKRVYYLLLTSVGIKIAFHMLYALGVDNNSLIYIFLHIAKIGSAYLIYKAIVEVSLRKPYEKLIRVTNRYNRLVNLLPDSVFILKGSKILFANDAAVRLAKVGSKEELLRQEVENFLKPHPDYEDMVEKRAQILREKESSVDFLEHKVILKDGTHLDAEIGGLSTYHEGQLLTILVCRDISDRKRAQRLKLEVEEEKLKLNQAIEHDQLKTQFFSTISHELKTPLNIILGSTQLMDHNHSRGNKDLVETKLEKYIGMTKQNCYRLLRLINNLIDITRVDANFLKVSYKNYDIVNIIENITLSVAEYINSYDINLIFDTDIEEKVMLCDADKLERIMLNLLSNAVKFTESGGTIEVRLYDLGNRVNIAVRDTGIGIPSDKLEDIFERFNQVDASLTRKKEGSGIGLSLVKSLIELHRGKISVKSELGKGSEFLIELPVNLRQGEPIVYEEIALTQEEKIERINIEFSDIYS